MTAVLLVLNIVETRKGLIAVSDCSGLLQMAAIRASFASSG